MPFRGLKVHPLQRLLIINQHLQQSKLKLGKKRGDSLSDAHVSPEGSTHQGPVRTVRTEFMDPKQPFLLGSSLTGFNFAMPFYTGFPKLNPIDVQLMVLGEQLMVLS